MHRNGAAQAVYEEVSFQQQSSAPEAHSAPRMQRCLNLLLAESGRMPRCQRKATVDCDTAVRLCTSVHQLQPYLYSQKFSSISPLEMARPPFSAGFKTVLKQCGFQPQLLTISTQAKRHTAAQIGCDALCPHYASPLLCCGCNDR